MNPVVNLISKSALFFLTVALLANSAFAESGKEAVTLETMVVTASREKDETFQTGDVDIEQTPAFFSFIKRENFEGRIENVGEVLRKEAGIQIRQSGGLGSFSSVSLRGASSDQVMIFMDGVLLNDASYGGVDLSNIALSDVEAIEVYRGVTPLNFGKASIGGVVNIRTLRSKGDFKASATSGYGSFDTRKLSGFVNHKPGKGDYLISADYLASHNDFWILNDQGTDFWPYDDKWEKRYNNDFEQTNLLTKLGYDFTEDLRLDFSNQWFSKDQYLPSWNNSKTTGYFEDGGFAEKSMKTSFDTKRNNTIVKLTADNVGVFNMSGFMDYSWKKEEYDDRYGAIGLGEQHNEYLTTSCGGHCFLELPTDRNILSLMLDARWEYYEPEDLLYRDRNPKDSSRETFTMGVQDTLFLFEESLSVTPALRYYMVNDELKSGVSAYDEVLEGREENKDYFSPQIGIKYQVFDWLVLKSNLAKYTREPSFFELFGDRGFFLGNSDLKAEEGVNFDVGFLFNKTADSRLINRISWDAAYFRSDMDDLITRVYDSRGVGKSINVSGAKIKGVETEIRIDFLRYLRLVANATWQDTVNLDKTEEFYRKKLSGRFDNSYMARLEAKYSGIKVYGEYLHQSDMYYDTANSEELKAKDKNEFNAGASWLFKSCLLSFEAKNLGNDRYEDFNGYYMPGRSYYCTLKHNF